MNKKFYVTPEMEIQDFDMDCILFNSSDTPGMVDDFPPIPTPGGDSGDDDDDF